MRTGTANQPLHTGNAPAWLFGRMVRLAREIVSLLVMEFGTEEVLNRMSGPYWFQAMGCVLGFDWHSSGVTTTTCGAIKEGIKGLEGVGGKTVRALAMIADLVYGAPMCDRDPAVYSFAHGGKDGTPYPVDRRNYDRTISIIKRAVEQARLGNTETAQALKRLGRFYEF